MSDDFRVVVVEKYGYGFSDIVDEERPIEVILEETRAALSGAGIEALYWAQSYPEEVEAIIGLDMAVPASYENYKFNMPFIYLAHFAANIGITRWLPGSSESDAIKYGTLTEEEKEIYRTVFYQRTMTVTMLNEIKNISDINRSGAAV